jgi:hypothetical protein
MPVMHWSLSPRPASPASRVAPDMVRATPFAVGAEFLGLVGAQQEAGPVALVIDDAQWADRRSAEALSFTFRRLSVDSVAVILIIRGDREHLDATARQLLVSTPQRQRVVLSGLSVEDVAPLAAAGTPCTCAPCSATQKACGSPPSRIRWRQPSGTSLPRCPRRPGRCWTCWPS